jgi:hypothetical protein
MMPDDPARIEFGDSLADLRARGTLLLCSLALSTVAGQCEQWLTRALGVPHAAFRLHFWMGPIVANATVLCAFATIGFAHARRRQRSLTWGAYVRCIREASLYMAPALVAVLLLASTAALFAFAALDRLYELVTRRHLTGLADLRLYGTLYGSVGALYCEVQRRCGSVGDGSYLPVRRVIDAKGCIQHV